MSKLNSGKTLSFNSSSSYIIQTWEGEKATDTLQETKIKKKKNLDLALSILIEEEKKRLSVIMAILQTYC